MLAEVIRTVSIDPTSPNCPALLRCVRSRLGTRYEIALALRTAEGYGDHVVARRQHRVHAARVPDAGLEVRLTRTRVTRLNLPTRLDQQRPVRQDGPSPTTSTSPTATSSAARPRRTRVRGRGPARGSTPLPPRRDRGGGAGPDREPPAQGRPPHSPEITSEGNPCAAARVSRYAPLPWTKVTRS